MREKKCGRSNPAPRSDLRFPAPTPLLRGRGQSMLSPISELQSWSAYPDTDADADAGDPAPFMFLGQAVLARLFAVPGRFFEPRLDLARPAARVTILHLVFSVG